MMGSQKSCFRMRLRNACSHSSSCSLTILHHISLSSSALLLSWGTLPILLVLRSHHPVTCFHQSRVLLQKQNKTELSLDLSPTFYKKIPPSYSIQRMFGWREWRSGIKIRKGTSDSHSNHLVGKSPIPIPISGWNGNGTIYIELNPYFSLYSNIHSNFDYKPRGYFVRNQNQNGNRNQNG